MQASKVLSAEIEMPKENDVDLAKPSAIQLVI
jgi:hypothetical protein